MKVRMGGSTTAGPCALVVGRRPRPSACTRSPHVPRSSTAPSRARGQDMTSSEPQAMTSRRCVAPWSSPRAVPAPTPTRASAASCSTPPGEVVAEGWHRGAGTPHAEVDALARAGEPRPGRHRRRHPRALQPHRPHRAVRRRRCIAAGVARVVSTPRPTPTRSPPAARTSLRAAGVDVEGGLLADEATRRSTARGRSLVDAPAARSSPGSSPPPSTAAAPPPTAPAAGSPREAARARRPPAARRVRRDPGRHRHGAGRRPAADRARRGRQRSAARRSRCAS